MTSLACGSQMWHMCAEHSLPATSAGHCQGDQDYQCARAQTTLLMWCAEEGSQQGSRQTVEQLEGLLGEASGLLQEHHQAYLKYQGLPLNHRFRKSS